VRQRRLVYPTDWVPSSRRTDRVHCPSAGRHWWHLDAYHTDRRHTAVQHGLRAVCYVPQLAGQPNSVCCHFEHYHVREQRLVAARTGMRRKRSCAPPESVWSGAAAAATESVWPGAAASAGWRCLLDQHAGLADQPSGWQLDANNSDGREPELRVRPIERANFGAFVVAGHDSVRQRAMGGPIRAATANVYAAGWRWPPAVGRR